MQKSLMTSRMQSSCWVNYDRPMTLFAAAVKAGPAQQSLATVKRKTIVMHVKRKPAVRGPGNRSPRTSAVTIVPPAETEIS